MRVRAQIYHNADTVIASPSAPAPEMLRPEPGQTLTILTKGADGQIQRSTVAGEGAPPPNAPVEAPAIHYGANQDMWQQKAGAPELPQQQAQTPPTQEPAASPANTPANPPAPEPEWRIVRDPQTGQIVTRVRNDLVETQMFNDKAYIHQLHNQIRTLQSAQQAPPPAPEPPKPKFAQTGLKEQLLPIAQNAFKGYDAGDINPIVDFVSNAVEQAVAGVRGEYEAKFGELTQQTQQQAQVAQFRNEATQIIAADPRFGTIGPDGTITFDPKVNQYAQMYPGEGPMQIHQRLIHAEYMANLNKPATAPPATTPPPAPQSQIPQPPPNMFQTPNGSASTQSQWDSDPEVARQVAMFKRTQPNATPEAINRVRSFAIQSVQSRQGVSPRQQEGAYAHGIR